MPDDYYYNHLHHCEGNQSRICGTDVKAGSDRQQVLSKHLAISKPCSNFYVKRNRLRTYIEARICRSPSHWCAELRIMRFHTLLSTQHDVTILGASGSKQVKIFCDAEQLSRRDVVILALADDEADPQCWRMKTKWLSAWLLVSKWSST